MLPALMLAEKLNILFEQKLHSKFPQIKKIDNGIWCSSPWIF